MRHPIPQGFSSLVLKPYVKGVTHSEELGWWSILMVDCVTLFWLNFPTIDFLVQSWLLNVLVVSWTWKLGCLGIYYIIQKPPHRTSLLQYSYSLGNFPPWNPMLGKIVKKRVTQSTIEKLHQPSSSNCVTTFPCSLPITCPNDDEGKLQ